MKIYFKAAIRDGLYRRSEATLSINVEDDATDDDIDDSVRDEILNNLLEFNWSKDAADL
jgi:hypothetical protein